MTEETAKVLEGWDTRASGGRPLDVAMEMTLLTQRIVVKTMFGADVGAEGRRIARAFETALAGVGARFVLPLSRTRLPLPTNRRFEKALQTIDEAVHGIIRERRSNGQEGGRHLLPVHC